MQIPVLIQGLLIGADLFQNLSRGKKPSNGSLARAKGGAIGMLQKVDGGNYTMDGQPKDRIFVKEELELLLPYPKCYSTEYSILVPLAYGPVPHKTTAGEQGKPRAVRKLLDSLINDGEKGLCQQLNVSGCMAMEGDEVKLRFSGVGPWFTD